MAGADNFHSVLVGWTKIILPVFAIGLLSTLFLFARNPTAAPPEFSFTEIAAMAREQRITSPRFSGVTQSGSTLVVSAKSAQPNLLKADNITLDTVAMRLENADGSHINMSALSGAIDGPARVAHFSGLTYIVTSTGYEMETNGLTAELDTGLIISDGKTQIRAPFGDLTAGQATFRVTEDNTGQQMLFTQGVRLVYEPDQ